MRRVRREILGGAIHPTIGLMRSRALIVIGTVMYVVAWFLPVFCCVPSFRIGEIIGGDSPITAWWAFRFALWPYDGGSGPPWYIGVLYVASALSNAVVIGILALVFIARRSPPRFLRAMLVASAVLNTHWFVLGPDRSGLRIGYYLWASSFFVIAAGLILEGRQNSPRWRDISVTVGALRLTGSRFHHRGYLRDLARGRREAFMLDLLSTALRPGMLMLDVGAYLGTYTLVAAEKVGSTGRVYAFEPDPRNFAYLQMNVADNGFADRVVLSSKAVTNHPGMVPFYLDTGLTADFSRSGSSLSSAWGHRRDVEGVVLDEFLRDAPPVDLIKLDIEGGELRALDGMIQTIQRASSRLLMFVELNDKALRAAGGSATGLLARLRSLGVCVQVIDERNRRLVPVDRPDRVVNLYCLRKAAGEQTGGLA